MFLRGIKEDRELTMFITTLARVGSWFYYDVPRSTKVIARAIFFIYEFTSVVGNLAVFKVSLKELYIESSASFSYIDMMYVQCTFIVFSKNIKYLNQFAERMRNILKKRNRDWEVKIFDETCSLPWKLVIIYHNMIVVFVLSILCPFVYDMILLIIGVPAEPLSKCNYFEVYLSDSKEKNLMFIVTMFITVCVAIIGGCKYYTFLCTISATVTYVNAELRILSKHLELWSKDKKNIHRDIIFRKIIQEHIEILDLIKMMKKYLGELYLCQNVIYPLTITLCLFSINQALKNGNTDTAIRVTYIMIGFIINLFFTCYFGQNLYDETVRFSDALYFIPWYEEPVRVRKDLFTMMLATNKPIVINFKGIFSINLLQFKDVMNATYSFFTILQNFV